MLRQIRSRLMVSAAAVGTLVAFAVAGSPVATAAQPRARVGDLAPRAALSVTGAALAPARPLSVTVELAPRNPLALKAFATAVSTPGRRDYHRYVTARGFGRRFGATAAHAAAVARELRASGLHVGALTRNAMQLSASGTVRQVDRAFAVRERHVRTADGRRAYANDVAPTLPVSIAPYVQTVVGLDDVVRAQPENFPAPAGRHPGIPQPRAGRVHADYSSDGGPQMSTSCGGYAQETSQAGESADEIANAYDFDGLYGQGDLGAGQTIAVYEDAGYNASSVTAYATCYGLPAPTITAIKADAGTYSGSQGDAVESDLDLEILVGMAPAAALDVYEAQSPLGGLQRFVADDTAQVLSISYGDCEQDEDAAYMDAENTALQEAAAQGQTVFASSGDAGSTTCQQSTREDPTVDYGLSVSDPASQPYVTAVGATNLSDGTKSDGYTNAYVPGRPFVESVWNDGFSPYTDSSGGPTYYAASATGGGLSEVFTMPVYQSGASAALGVVNPESSGVPCTDSNGDCREIPDVSADGDPYTGYIVDIPAYGWTPIGGTSASSPLWAAFAALANALPACGGRRLGFLNPSLYAIAGSAYASDFGDVSLPSAQSGAADNDPFNGGGAPAGAVDAPGGHFAVTAGYDMTTGLGSMKAAPLAQSLCGDVDDTVSITTPGAQTSTVGTAVSLPVTATDAAGKALSFTATGLPAGLAINGATGVISGTPTTVANTSVTVTATDDGGVGASTSAFTWTVHAAPPPPPPAAPAPTTTTATPPATTTTTTTPSTPTTDRPTAVKLSGLAAGRPSLSLAWNVAAGSAPLTALQISVPPGLSFAGARAVVRGLVVRSAGKRVGFTVRVAGRTVTITFARPASKLTISLSRGALTISRAEVGKVETGKVRSLRLKVTGVAKHRRTARTVTVPTLG